MVQSRNITGSGYAYRRWQSHIEDLLDEALTETFPASDPVSIAFEDVEMTASRRAGEPGTRRKRKALPSDTGRRH